MGCAPYKIRLNADFFSDLSVSGQELSLVAGAGQFSGPAVCVFTLSLFVAMTCQ